MNLQAIEQFRAELVANHAIDLAACDRLLHVVPALAGPQTPPSSTSALPFSKSYLGKPPRRPKPRKLSGHTSQRAPRGDTQANIIAAIATLPARWSKNELTAALPEYSRSQINSTLDRMVKQGLYNRSGTGRETVFFANGNGPALPRQAKACTTNDPEIQRRQANYQAIRSTINVPRDKDLG